MNHKKHKAEKKVQKTDEPNQNPKQNKEPGLKPWTILLYYHFTPIQYPVKFAREHLKMCKELGLKGRILVAKEGINGTVGGPKAATDKYIKLMRADEKFKKMEFKLSLGPAGTFKKMFVRHRNELVTLNAPETEVDPSKEQANYIEPEELKKLYDSNKDFVILDMRNLYEYEIGRFKNAIPIKMNVFKELPKIVKDLEKYKDKKVVTYCTGGIRCEKGALYLKKKGFKDVSQLHGGVHVFGEKFPDNYWEGKLFVFDERMQVQINSKENDKIIAKCMHCSTPWDTYENCINAKCNKLILICDKCKPTMNRACSRECALNPRDKKYLNEFAV